MANINDLFNKFPDYDVFSGKTAYPKRNPRPKIKPDINPEIDFETDTREKTDYGDRFGVADKPVTVNNNTGNNFLTVLFFPVLILWLELFLRIACSEGFSAVSFLYTLGFTIPIATVLTLICTLFGEIFNRILCNVFSFIITAFYLYQLCYFSVFGSFLTFSSIKAISPELFISAIMSKAFFAIAIVLPFFLNLLFGHKVFGFRRLRIPGKIIVLLVAVLIQIGTFSALNFTTEYDPESIRIYNSSDTMKIQERFGILTMERLDLFK